MTQMCVSFGHSTDADSGAIVEKPVETVNNRVYICGYHVEITLWRHKIVEKTILFRRLWRTN